MAKRKEREILRPQDTKYVYLKLQIRDSQNFAKSNGGNLKRYRRNLHRTYKKAALNYDCNAVRGEGEVRHR